jgi:hypothetical protein
MMGMSSVEWSRYMHDVIGLEDPPEEISAEVVRRLEGIYREELPLIEGAPEAVASADVEIRSITDLTPEVVEEGASGR